MAFMTQCTCTASVLATFLSSHWNCTHRTFHRLEAAPGPRQRCAHGAKAGVLAVEWTPPSRLLLCLLLVRVFLCHHQFMEENLPIRDRRLLARLVLAREEARGMMSGGFMDPRNDIRGLQNLPEAEVRHGGCCATNGTVQLSQAPCRCSQCNKEDPFCNDCSSAAVGHAPLIGPGSPLRALQPWFLLFAVSAKVSASFSLLRTSGALHLGPGGHPAGEGAASAHHRGHERGSRRGVQATGGGKLRAGAFSSFVAVLL